MKKPNIPLIIGALILFGLLTVMIFPDFFATQNPYTIQHMRFLHTEVKLDVERAPFAPDGDYLLGSDDLGRDIFSYILYGTRMTIAIAIFIALSEFLLAVPLALFAGFGKTSIKILIEKFNILFSAIPAVLIAVIVLNLDYFAGQDKTHSVISFVLVLTAVGWARVGILVLERVEGIMVKPFIKGEVAIGKSGPRIALENVLPHLAPELMVLFFMELARCLSLLMQLGIFAVFVGNLGLINDPTAGVPINMEISYEPEWASMLSSSRVLLTTAPWAVFYPALAFFISVLGFNLFGEGLRIRAERKRMKSSLKGKARGKFVAVGVFAVVIVILIGQRAYDEKRYAVSYAEVSGLPESVFVGTNSSKTVSELIADEMQEIGLSPLSEAGYIMPYVLEKTALLKRQKMTWSEGTEEETEAEVKAEEFAANRDFHFIRTGNLKVKAPIYDARKLDLFTMEAFHEFDDHFVLMDPSYYSESATQHFIEAIALGSKAKGILLVSEKVLSGKVTVQLEEADAIPVVEITSKLAERLASEYGSILSLEAEVTELSSEGYNVAGVLEGSDAYIGEEAIVVGLGYNYLDSSGQDTFRFNLNLMERISSLEKNRRSVLFVFYDGTLTDDLHGVHAFSQEYPYSSQDTQVYIDLTGVTKATFNTLEFSADQAPVTRQFAWSLANYIHNQLQESDYEIDEIKAAFNEGSYYFTENASANAMFWNRGIPTIVIGSSDEVGNLKNGEDLGRIILKSINDNNY